MTCNIPPIPPKMRKCLGCDVEFAITAGKAMKRYHNDACRDKANEAKRVAAEPPKEPQLRLVCELPSCTAVFVAKTHTQRFCCESHQIESKRQKEQEQQTIEAQKLRTCSNPKCGKSFRLARLGASREFCSAACRDAGREASVSLLNHLSYLNRKGARKGSAE